MKRLFVGIPVAQEVKTQILSLYPSLVETGASFSLVDEKNLHFTLIFLGEVEESKIGEIENTLNNIAQKYYSFSCTIQEINAFPTANDPKIVWIGSKAEQLRTLMKDTLNALSNIRPSEHADATPHCTIARIKKSTPELIQFILQHRHASFGTMEVSQLHLIESTLTPKGPIYKPVKVFMLK